MQLCDLKRLTASPSTASLSVQLAKITTRQTSSGKPFLDLEVADSSDSIKLKIWSDTAAFEFCSQARDGDFCQLEGEFFVNDYGVNINHPSFSYLDESQIDAFLQGSPERAHELDAHWTYLTETFNNLKDPRLQLLATTILTELSHKWKRAAAAKNYHHARRGGLLEHTSQMLRCAKALAPQYPEIWPDLLYCGVLFHDIGKCWENDYPARGFFSEPARMGEMLGHITIGVEVINRYWNQLKAQHPEIFSPETQPPSELLREHLLHLIVAHHGQLEFGSPVHPKIPEAWMLHYIDNLDARMEMMRASYALDPEVEPDLYKARRPLTGFLARPISDYLSGKSLSNESPLSNP